MFLRSWKSPMLATCFIAQGFRFARVGLHSAVSLLVSISNSLSLLWSRIMQSTRTLSKWTTRTRSS